MSTISSLLQQSSYKGLPMASVTAWAPTEESWFDLRRRLTGHGVEFEQSKVETAEGPTSLLRWNEAHVSITFFAPVGFLAEVA